MFGTSRSSDYTALYFRECELGILFGNNDVAVKGHFHSSPKGSTIDCRNDWFVEGVSSRYRAETVRHAYQFLLVIGDLSADTRIVSL